jgi:Mg-chelatase subunit ChlD
MVDYLKVDSYDYNEFSDMNLELACLHNKKSLNVDLLVEISSSSEQATRKPLNICFALDRSASMEENNRMEKLKNTMKEILSFLMPDDYLSIIAYDDFAQVILPSRQYGIDNDSIFRELIDRITLGGGTNMLAGMLKGYAEVDKNYNRLYRNRLILMSDGVSTNGEREPSRILKHTINYYNKGIETSTIGIGNNINFDLLHDISVEGRGNSHFVGDCDSAYIDIEYVLKEELYSMYTSMEDIELEISYPKHLKIIDVYGASKVVATNEKLIVSCSNLSQKNQLLLIKFQSKKKNLKDPLKVHLNFIENDMKKDIIKQITWTNNRISSEKILMANRIVAVVNCVKNRLVDQRYKLDCVDSFISEMNVPDNIVLLRELIK